MVTPHPPPLHISHCQELANHYLGFNGWNTRIAALTELSSKEEGGGGKREVAYRCVAEVEVKGCDGVSVGVGLGRLELENPGELHQLLFYAELHENV